MHGPSSCTCMHCTCVVLLVVQSAVVTDWVARGSDLSWDVEHENVQDSLACNVNAKTLGRRLHVVCVQYIVCVCVHAKRMSWWGRTSQQSLDSAVSNSHQQGIRITYLAHHLALYMYMYVHVLEVGKQQVYTSVSCMLPKVQRSLYFQHNSSSTHAALQLLLYVCILQPLKTHYRHTHSTYMYMHTHITTDACTHTLTIPDPHNCVHLHHHTY